MLKPSNFMPKGILRYAKGDATAPVGGSVRYILQVCNAAGKYGAGFSGAVSKKWPVVETEYRSWWRKRFGKLEMGSIQTIYVQSDTVVVNMIAQADVVSKDNPAPIDYKALEKALSAAGVFISNEKGSAHMPRIGCGLAGGDWSLVEPLIIEQLSKRGINVTVYDLPEKS